MTTPTQQSETPFSINLEQQQKRAKELLNAFHSSDESARQHFTQHHSKWQALSKSTLLPLYEIYQSKNIKHLPNMKGALLRHLQELPSTKNGLSLTEQITLEILNDKQTTAGDAYRQLMRERDPLPWLGNVMYWFIIYSMTQTSTPILEMPEDDPKDDLGKPWQKRLLTITDNGRKVLSGQLNWLTLNPPERWFGGIKKYTLITHVGAGIRAMSANVKLKRNITTWYGKI